MKRILCYGDSNTWGFVPSLTGDDRWPEDVRWTGVCQKKLGADYRILEDGLNGRTTVWDDFEGPWRNGKDALGYTLLSQKPIDLFVLSLGVNDLKFVDAITAGEGTKKLLQMILDADAVFNGQRTGIFRHAPKILVLGLVQLHPDIIKIQPDTAFCEKYKESLRLEREQQKVAMELGLPFLPMSRWACASPVDGVHMDAENHYRYGNVVAEKIQEIFKDKEKNNVSDPYL